MNPDQYTESHLQQLFAEDTRITELGIRAVRVEDGWALCGEVESAQRREMIERIVTATFPTIRIHMAISISEFRAPVEVESV